MTLPRTPALATDCVIFDAIGRVLLIRRKHPPLSGAMRCRVVLSKSARDGFLSAMTGSCQPSHEAKRMRC
jgi:hypothetical protein